MFFVLLVTIICTILRGVYCENKRFILLLKPIDCIVKAFFIVTTHTCRVLVLFGAYKRLVRDHGVHWVLPFYAKQRISLCARNFYSEKVKVNDKIGNLIMINVILVCKWQTRTNRLSTLMTIKLLLKCKSMLLYES